MDSARKKGEEDASVDLFIGNENKEQMVQMVEDAMKAKGIWEKASQDRPVPHMTQAALEQEHTRAYIKVQNGCNQYCTYCIIPFVRGPLISRDQADVLQEVRQLAERGCQEVVVTGIHLSSYGVDQVYNDMDRIDANQFLKLDGEPLLQLLQAISEIEGIERIRMGSLEPRIVTESFASKLAQVPKICPHFHLSLQSGCDATLQRMNRHYSTQEYQQCVNILRKYLKDPAITTDIIVGFPQETQEEFDTTCAFAKEVAFAQIHVFKYSRRQGTIADGLDGQITEAVKSERSDVLLQIENELEQKYQSLFVDTEQEMLVEEISEIDGQRYLTGYNERYVRLAVPVDDAPDVEARCNTIATVRVLGQITPEVLEATWR